MGQSLEKRLGSQIAQESQAGVNYALSQISQKGGLNQRVLNQGGSYDSSKFSSRKDIEGCHCHMIAFAEELEFEAKIIPIFSYLSYHSFGT